LKVKDASRTSKHVANPPSVEFPRGSPDSLDLPQRPRRDSLVLVGGPNTLVPKTETAVSSEPQRRGLNTQNATPVKKRFDALAAVRRRGRSRSRSLRRYERNMRHFVGWEQPKFSSPYGHRDIRTMFASIPGIYRLWKAFRDHTGDWRVFSIWFHFLSWLAVLGLMYPLSSG
jgi:hypothetical protein